MSESDAGTDEQKFLAPAFARRGQTLFWWVYFLFPLFTQILAYDWLPNESYNSERHELLAAHEVCDNWGRCDDKYDAWADKKTREVFTYAAFEGHRKSEAIRMAVADTFYALIGCFMFAYLNATVDDGSFHRKLGQAVCVAAGYVGFAFVMRYFS